MKNFLFLVFGFWVPVNLMGQDSLAIFRWASEKGRFDIQHELIPLGDRGAFFLEYKTLYNHKTPGLEIVKLDTNLTEVWRIYQKLGRNFTPLFSKSNLNTVVAVFKEFNKSRFQILVLESDTRKHNLYETKLLLNFEVDDFLISERGLIFTGTFNNKYVAQFFDFNTGTSKILAHLYNNKLEDIKIQISKFDHSIFVFTNDNKSCLKWIFQYSPDGEFIQKKEIGHANYRMSQAYLVEFGFGEQWVCGTYDQYCGRYSLGLFWTPLVLPNQARYMPYSDLKNVYSYLPQDRSQRLMEKLEKRKAQNKENTLKFQVFLHPPKLDLKGIHLVAEVFSESTIRRKSVVEHKTEVDNQYHFHNFLLWNFDYKIRLGVDYSVALSNSNRDHSLPLTENTWDGEILTAAYFREKEVSLKYVNLQKSTQSEAEDRIIPFDMSDMKMSQWYSQKYLLWGYKWDPVSEDNVFEAWILTSQSLEKFSKNP